MSNTTDEALVDAHDYDPNPDEPTVVESLEEAALILEENPLAAVLIRPKQQQS